MKAYKVCNERDLVLDPVVGGEHGALAALHIGADGLRHAVGGGLADEAGERDVPDALAGVFVCSVQPGPLAPESQLWVCLCAKARRPWSAGAAGTKRASAVRDAYH